MKFVLFVEGHTEHRALSAFLRRWLDPRLEERVGVQTVLFDGWAGLVKETPVRAGLYLNAPKQDVLAVIALIDLYGAELPYPLDKITAAERCAWGKSQMEAAVNHPKFRQFFAVHEVEVWLLSSPAIFPADVRDRITAKSARPEEVNSEEPPAKFLDRLYLSKFRRHYKKTINGADLFANLDPEIAAQKCPHLRALLDEMLRMAQAAGL